MLTSASIVEGVMNRIPGYDGDEETRIFNYEIIMADGTPLSFRLECNVNEGPLKSLKNPIILVSTRYGYNEEREFMCLGCSEIMKPSQHLKFDKDFTINYRFGVEQFLRIDLFDVLPVNIPNFEGKVTPLDMRYGSSIISFHDFFLAKQKSKDDDESKNTISLPLTLFKKSPEGEEKKTIENGTIHIQFVTNEEKKKSADDSEQIVLLRPTATGLPKMDLIGKGDPYFYFHVENGVGGWNQLYKSEAIMNTQNPVWNPVMFRMSTLTQTRRRQKEEEEKEKKELEQMGGFSDEEEEGEKSKEEEEEEEEEELPIKLKIDCYDWDKDTSDDEVGSCELTLKELLLEPEKEYRLIYSKKKKKKRGHIKFSSEIKKKNKFYSFISSNPPENNNNLNLEVSIAIDFSTHGNNLHKLDEQSLHYCVRGNDEFKNLYERVISTISGVLELYNNTSSGTRLYGCGVKFVDEKEIASITGFFPVTGDDEKKIIGVENILKEYKGCLIGSEMSPKPIRLANLISHVSQKANLIRNNENNKHYSVLVILTGSDCEDLKDTIESLIDSSHHPLSVIICALGGRIEMFKKMEAQLGASKGTLRMLKKVSVRDNLTFSKFSQYMKYNKNLQMEGFIAEALCEIPNQIEDYFAMKGVSPEKE